MGRHTFQARVRRTCGSLFGVLLLLITTASTATTATATEEYGIYRNDQRVGTHTVTRYQDDALTTVEVQSRIRVTLLGIELYGFSYAATETWDRDGILRLVASVDDDGERLELSGERRGDAFSWQVNGVRQSHPMPLYPTNHWNAGVLQQDHVLNTLTGNINRVRIVPLGTQDGLAGSANAYRYDGELRLQSWYRADGEWVGMRFETERGDTIDYRCLTCNEVGTP